MTTRTPKLSIGIPVYNGESFLPGLLTRLAAQTYTDFEIVISDNASTDRTRRICLEWVERDPRVRYHRNPSNVGASANFNKVFGLCKAPLFKWAACDDTYGPAYLEACVRILDENPDVVLAQTEVVCIDESGRPFERDPATGTFIIPGTNLRYATDPIDIGESGSALRRYWDVLYRCRSNSQVFGVIRREALAATGLLPNYLGAEKATVLELSLIGRFQQDRRALFNRCYHPGITEVKGNKEGKAYIAAGDDRYSRSARMLRSFFSTPLGKPVPLFTKLACFALLLSRGFWFLGRVIGRKEAKDWPFRAAWGSAKGRSGPVR